jgi:hypothetical protein
VALEMMDRYSVPPPTKMAASNPVDTQ